MGKKIKSGYSKERHFVPFCVWKLEMGKISMFALLKKKVFIIYLKGRETKNSHLKFFSPNVCNSWGWAGPILRARNSMLVSQVGTGTQLFALSLMPPRVDVSKKSWNGDQSRSLNTGTVMGVQIAQVAPQMLH